jgi:predicted transcriptional regulator
MAPLDSIGRVKTKTIQKEAELKRLFDLIFLNENWGAIRGNRRGTGGIIPDDWMRKNVLPAIQGNKKALKELSRITGRTIPDLKSAFEKRIPFLEETRVTAAAESFPEDRRLTPEKALEKQQKIKLKRGERLDKTVGQQAKYLKGTDAFPFHHIMPIGGEAQLTTNDVAVISKQMNSKLAPYNTKLNDIADGISNNISKAYTTRSEGGSFEFMKRIDELNDQAEKLVAKATKELPKKFQPYIGFTKLTPRTDEYGFPLDDKLIEERVGAVREKGIPLRDLTSDQLSKLKNSIKSLSEKEKIGYCSLLSRGGLPGDCAAAIDNNPVKAAEVFDEAPVTSKGMEKVKNAASSFLNFAKRGGKFGALAAVGAGAAAIVKPFMNDDPTTYLSNEDQQKNMLIDMVTGQLDDTPVEEAPIGEAYLPALGAATVAGTAVTAPSTIDAVRKGALGAKKSGITKTALKTLGKGFAASQTPLGILATEPLYLAEQIQEGDSLGEIATNPLNYFAPAFAADADRLVSRGLKSPGIAKAMRLGISPAALRIGSRFFGLPGLALSLGISGYEMYDDYKKKRGMFSEE